MSQYNSHTGKHSENPIFHRLRCLLLDLCPDQQKVCQKPATFADVLREEYEWTALSQQIETHCNVVLSQLIALKSCPSSSSSRRILYITASSLCIVSLQNEVNRKADTVFYPIQEEVPIWGTKLEMFSKMF